MSCLSDCSCTKSVQEIDVSEERIAHEEPSYYPLSEAINLSEAIPLLPKDFNMLKHEAYADHYELLTVIGHGFCNAAKISLAKHKPSGHHVAIKRIDLDKCTEDLNYVQNEILVYRQLRHENILPYLCTFVNNSEIWAIMPVLSFGSAKSIMKTHFPDGIPEIAISFILKDILLALDYLHKRGFIHRSVKASHILISSSGKAVLSGLRYSCNVLSKGKWQTVIHSFPHDSVPNLNWLSPEVLGQNLMGYSSKSDIYSLGMTVWELTNGVSPFAKILPTQMLLEKLQGNILQALNLHCAVNSEESNLEIQKNKSSVESNHKLGDGSVYLSQVFSESFQAFIQLCLHKDPMRRPTASQLRTHAFIKQTKKSQITLLDVLAIVSPVVEQNKAPKAEEEKELSTEKLNSVDFEDYWIF